MRYRILGVTQAADDQGTPIPLGGPRVRALLTALALHPGRTVTPESLIDEVWADDPPQDAPAALQALVARLRRTAGRHTVTSEPGGYRLAAARDDVDLYVFERLVRTGKAALDRGDAATAARELREALALWRGPALADLPDRAAATRPEALRLEATRTRIAADLQLGRAPDAVPELRELTAAHPYDEPLHALLLRALRDSGRHADALAAYEGVRQNLLEGLGTDPGPELRALHRELLAGALDADSVSVPEPGPPVPPSGNIRRRLNSFVGREPELAAIRAEMRGARLLTLTGPGGSGKTRLAEEAAAGLPQAWLAELAPLERPEAVPSAVVSALGLRETVLITNELSAATAQADPVALLVEYCAPRGLLLILDNCEHVIGAAAGLAETLLTHCPDLTILATSREPLGVPGELVRPVEPLPLDPAHRLFMERAAAARPDGDAVHDPRAVDEICRRLDGLPLAIELAAARLRLLTPRQIADRLDDRFRLLTSGSRTVLPRQQTLRAVVDWSWDLLDERERTVLCEASVFAGGWDLAAAEAVCTGPAADLVGALVDKSLIVATPYEDGAGGGMRYRMLETIHEYAAERADEVPGLRAAAERRHRAWARALVEEAEPQLRSAGQLPWIRRLETELDNIRAALRRAVLAGAEEEAGSLALAMCWFWWLRNYRQEGAEWTGRILRLGVVLDAGGDLSASDAADPVRAYLAGADSEETHPLHRMRMRLRMQELFLLAEAQPLEVLRDRFSPEYIRRVIGVFEKGGPDAAVMPGLVWPLAVHFLGLSEDLRPALDASVANCRRYGGDWERGVTLMFRTHMIVDSPGGLHGIDGDLAELRTLSRRVGDRWMRAQVCSAAGEAATARGRFEEARSEYAEALRLAREVSAHVETPFLMARLAEIAFRSGDRTGALAALDEASAAADRHGVTDSRAFILVLRAHMALEDGEPDRARELYEAARAESGRGTPPPQFLAVLGQIDALVTATEAGPERGLAKLAETLRQALDTRCAEWVTASLVESAARLFADMDDLPRAVRLLAAAGHWRGVHPRPMPERCHAERVEADALTSLGPRRCESERGRGADFTPDDALRELKEALDMTPWAPPGR
ncbi:BTAD domain-containing putative transcriptional regulator [Streptomyces sp. NPDC005551]|uniref:BTAD domain-containing putative transcriptional regulator n=1 Tax=Streptomyces sp. NPDC005551 TaxID=3364725 RepID=UPI0036CCBDFD